MKIQVNSFFYFSIAVTTAQEVSNPYANSQPNQISNPLQECMAQGITEYECLDGGAKTGKQALLFTPITPITPIHPYRSYHSYHSCSLLSLLFTPIHSFSLLITPILKTKF